MYNSYIAKYSLLKDWRLNGGSRFAKKDCLGLIVPAVWGLGFRV